MGPLARTKLTNLNVSAIQAGQETLALKTSTNALHNPAKTGVSATTKSQSSLAIVLLDMNGTDAGKN